MCHLHISHNVGHLPPKILHNLCFSFPVGIAAVPREIETMLIQNFGGQIMCIMGDVQVAYTFSLPHYNLFNSPSKKIYCIVNMAAQPERWKGRRKYLSTKCTVNSR